MQHLAHAHSNGPRPRRVQRTREDVMIPRIVLRALLGIVLFSLGAVLVAKVTGYGVMLRPEGVAVETRVLQFDARGDGTMVVRDHESGAEVALFGEGGGGFIQGVLRGLNRGRAVERLEGGDVYLLTRWDDGRLSVSDPVTGERFDLNSFGVDNLMAFARLLKSQEEGQ